MFKRTMFVVCVLQLVAIQTMANDPSSVPMCSFNGEKYVERWRVLADLDDDGVNDMILSGNPAMFGNGGGPWDVYLNRDGDYRKVGEIGAHPMAIALEPDQDRYNADLGKRRYARIWTYWHMSSSSGALGYFRVGEETVDECRSVMIYGGDGGTTMGNAMYEAVIKNSVIPFVLECSTTDEEGRVSWRPYKR